MSNLAQVSSRISYGRFVKPNPRNAARRRISAGVVVLAVALFAGAGWVMSYSTIEPSSAPQKTQTAEAPNTTEEFVYFPSQYVNQGTTEPTEPIPTF